MNTSLKVPLLTKEGARGRLLMRHCITSPDPSLVRRGFIGPAYWHRADKVLRASGNLSLKTMVNPGRPEQSPSLWRRLEGPIWQLPGKAAATQGRVIRL